MTKKELQQMIEKEAKRVQKNLLEKPHEPSWAEAMILIMNEIRKLEKKA